MSYLRQERYFSALLFFVNPNKPHNKAIYDTLATAGISRPKPYFPFLPYYCLHSLIATNRITKPFMTLRKLQEYLVRNRTFLFLPYYCVHSPIATNRITKPKAANFNCKHKNGRHDFSCLPSYFYQYHAVKPHCYAICSAFSSAVSLPHETHRQCQRRDLERHIAAPPVTEVEPSSIRQNGGIWSGSQPLRSCFPASSQAL